MNESDLTEFNNLLKEVLRDTLQKKGLTVSVLASRLQMPEETLQIIFSNPINARGPDLFTVLQTLNLYQNFIELSAKHLKTPIT